MKRIGLLSDTHSHLPSQVFEHFDECDEIWHAGDIGNPKVTEDLEKFKPLRAVWGNIDCHDLRKKFPEIWRFDCEGLDVCMTHIGGYPGKYAPKMRTYLYEKPPKLFICGHSHILKVINDPILRLLHVNPGACGLEGFHKIQTLMRFSIDEGIVKNMEVIELKSP